MNGVYSNGITHACNLEFLPSLTHTCTDLTGMQYIERSLLPTHTHTFVTHFPCFSSPCTFLLTNRNLTLHTRNPMCLRPGSVRNETGPVVLVPSWLEADTVTRYSIPGVMDCTNISTVLDGSEYWRTCVLLA